MSPDNHIVAMNKKCSQMSISLIWKKLLTGRFEICFVFNFLHLKMSKRGAGIDQNQSGLLEHQPEPCIFNFRYFLIFHSSNLPDHYQQLRSSIAYIMYKLYLNWQGITIIDLFEGHFPDLGPRLRRAPSEFPSRKEMRMRRWGESRLAKPLKLC